MSNNFTRSNREKFNIAIATLEKLTIDDWKSNNNRKRNKEKKILSNNFTKQIEKSSTSLLQ